MVVTCRHCKREYMRGVMGPTQASTCACHVKSGVIYGHYGSKHDTRKFQTSSPLDDMDPICDACVDQLLQEGTAIDIGEYLDFND